MHPKTTLRQAPGGLLRRVGWFVLLWAAGVGALAVAAGLLKALMHAAGMR
jgi:hypothetical protein